MPTHTIYGIPVLVLAPSQFYRWDFQKHHSLQSILPGGSHDSSSPYVHHLTSTLFDGHELGDISKLTNSTHTTHSISSSQLLSQPTYLLVYGSTPLLFFFSSFSLKIVQAITFWAIFSLYILLHSISFVSLFPLTSSFCVACHDFYRSLCRSRHSLSFWQFVPCSPHLRMWVTLSKSTSDSGSRDQAL